MFRVFFLHHRKLLSQLSRCAWKTICQYLEVSLSEKLQPAGILSIATAGDFLNWNPHVHALISSGVFRADGSFVTVPLFQENVLRELFEANVFKLLVSEGLITAELIARIRIRDFMFMQDPPSRKRKMRFVLVSTLFVLLPPHPDCSLLKVDC